MTTILLIEDNVSLRRNLAEMLTLEGDRVLCAANGAEGLRQLRAEKMDLILCDIMMPGMDGYEVLAQIRADAAMVSLRETQPLSGG